MAVVGLDVFCDMHKAVPRSGAEKVTGLIKFFTLS